MGWTELSLLWSKVWTNDDWGFIANILSNFILTPLCGAGLFGNFIIWFTWSVEPIFVPAQFFIKALALSDFVILLSSLVYVKVPTFSKNGEIVLCDMFYHLAMACQILGAHFTLAAVIIRWMAVFAPGSFRNVLTRTRVLVATGFLWLYCVAIVSAMALVENKTIHFADPQVNMGIYLASFLLGMQLPVFITAVLNISLVIRLVGLTRSLHSLASYTSQVAVENPVISSVLFMIFTTLTNVLAYHGQLAVQVLVLHYPLYLPEGCARLPHCRYFFFLFSIFLTVFNSCMSVVYFVVFSSIFRTFFMLRLRQMGLVSRLPITTSTPSAAGLHSD